MKKKNTDPERHAYPFHASLLFVMGFLHFFFMSSSMHLGIQEQVSGVVFDLLLMHHAYRS
jgi:hypothetical protein